jgi:uncharacterized protein YqgV (UPF0045/DUF77 family)
MTIEHTSKKRRSIATGGEEFERLLAGLADDVVMATVHWRMHVDIINGLQQRAQVFEQSRTFWHLTIMAHASEAVYRLLRVFDQEPTALHLKGWLETIANNIDLFSPEAAEQRFAGRPLARTLASLTSAPDAAALQADIESCSATDPDVLTLVKYRNTHAAHRGAKVTARALAPVEVPVEVFERLLVRAIEILNRYSVKYHASSHSTKIIGHDDFEYLMDSVQERVRSSRAKTTALVTQLRRAKATRG